MAGCSGLVDRATIKRLLIFHGAEIDILEAGHFALDEASDDIAVLDRSFLERLNRHAG